MYKVEELKNEIMKEARIGEDLLPAVRDAKRHLQVLTDKQSFYQKQTEDLNIQIESLGNEIRDALAAENDAGADKAIKKRSGFREKEIVFNSLSVEMEEIMIPDAQTKLADAEKKLFNGLQLAVSIKHNTVAAELNARLAEIEAALESWTNAVLAFSMSWCRPIPSAAAELCCRTGQYSTRWVGSLNGRGLEYRQSIVTASLM